jgi:two-component system, chemotaxis family, chemotaxis protein CheY
MPDRETRTILLVDSSASILFYVAMLLRRLEYKVLTARSCEDALRMMEGAVPSIVLTELSMPQMSGIQFIKHMKESERFKAIPVVVLTSESKPGTKETCTRMGCAAYLHKPVEPDELYKILQSVSESIPRTTIRVKTSLKVVIGDGSVAGGAKRAEVATAISEGGLFVRTLYPQPSNALTPLSVFIGDREIKATAVVLYVYNLGEGPFEEPGMGMKFVKISDDDRSVIRKFIRDQLTGDLDRHENGPAR